MPPRPQRSQPSSRQLEVVTCMGPTELQGINVDSTSHLSTVTHSTKPPSHLDPCTQSNIPPPFGSESNAVTPVGGPPTYPPPALPPGVPPPAAPPGLPKTLTSQMSVPTPLKPPPIPSRSSLSFRQASLSLPLGQPPPPPPRNK